MFLIFVLERVNSYGVLEHLNKNSLKQFTAFVDVASCLLSALSINKILYVRL